MQLIIDQLLIVSKNLSPTLADTFEEMILQAETGSIRDYSRTFSLFISYGSSYMMKFPEIFTRIVDLMTERVKECIF